MSVDLDQGQGGRVPNGGRRVGEEVDDRWDELGKEKALGTVTGKEGKNQYRATVYQVKIAIQCTEKNLRHASSSMGQREGFILSLTITGFGGKKKKGSKKISAFFSRN